MSNYMMPATPGAPQTPLSNYSQNYASAMTPTHHPTPYQHSTSMYGYRPQHDINDYERKRFLVELEFVQCLANPNYLYYLSKHGYFKRDEFRNYLKYLCYWKEPDYIKYIKFPECLYFLDLLQNDDLYDNITNLDCIEFITEQQMLNWQFYQRKRENCNYEIDEEPSEVIAPQSSSSCAPGTGVVVVDTAIATATSTTTTTMTKTVIVKSENKTLQNNKPVSSVKQPLTKNKPLTNTKPSK